MQSLSNSGSLSDSPALVEWLNHTASTRCIIHDIHKDKAGEDHQSATISENTISQIPNIMPPAIAENDPTCIGISFWERESLSHVVAKQMYLWILLNESSSRPLQDGA